MIFCEIKKRVSCVKGNVEKYIPSRTLSPWPVAWKIMFSCGDIVQYSPPPNKGYYLMYTPCTQHTDTLS